MVRHVLAKNLMEALDALHQGPMTIIAGGTDVMVQKRSAPGLPIAIVGDILFLDGVKELDFVKEDDSHLHLGAMTRLSTLAEHSSVPRLLKEAILSMASPAIRHQATLAGNIQNASPAGDSLPVLYALDAQIKCQNGERSRLIPIRDFITGVRRTVLQSDELIVAIVIPKKAWTDCHFTKVGTRKSDAISKISMAFAYKRTKEALIDLRIVFGAVAPTVVRDAAYEQTLSGLSMRQLQERIPEIVAHYASLISPINDQRSNAEYRKNVALNLLQEALSNLE